MNEMYREPEPKKEITPEENERYEQWMLGHPERVIAPENLRECGPEIAELEKLLVAFEERHSLEELLLIIDLTPAEAPSQPIREPAKKDLIPIVALLKTLKEETNISPEKHDELKEKYMRLSRAVGIINNNRVDHNR